METTDYYEQKARYNHPEVKDEWIEATLANPRYVELQADGRMRYYGYIDEAGKWLRVVLEDGKLLNRFLDRTALRKWGRP